MINDRLSDMLTRVKNASAVGKKEVVLPYSKLCENVAKVLESEKYLAAVTTEGEKADKLLKLQLQYVQGKPAISSLRRVSKPGVRIYTGIDSLKPILSGLGITILSTSKGIMSSKAAKKAHLGGEVLAELW